MMKSTFELESKFELNEADFEKLATTGELVKSSDQLNVYYDSDSLLSSRSATFRVRYVPNKIPVMTLKIPVSESSQTRNCLEVERPIDWNPPFEDRDYWIVQNDLPQEFASRLCELGIFKLTRMGSMQNWRRVVKLDEDLTIELDKVLLPNGHTFYEIEFECDDLAKHDLAQQRIKCIADSARPSMLSKYERFLLALSN